MPKEKMEKDSDRGARFQAARERTGLSQQAAGSAAGGVAQPTISRWERGESVDWETALKVAAVYDVEITWLMTGETDKSKLPPPPSVGPPYPAWEEFEATPEAQKADPDMLDDLRRLRWRDGQQPSLTNYLLLLSAYEAVFRHPK